MALAWQLDKRNLFNILNVFLATAIPNATVTWWFKGKELGRSTGDLDRNFEIRGHGPTSALTVTPLRSDYYGFYECKAQNPHGIAFHKIELEEAREPSMIQQAIIDKTTATTLQFRFVPPTDTGGLPVDAYAIEYKDIKSDWISAKRRVWPASKMMIIYPCVRDEKLGTHFNYRRHFWRRLHFGGSFSQDHLWPQIRIQE